MGRRSGCLREASRERRYPSVAGVKVLESGLQVSVRR